MATRQPRYSHEEFARRGQHIYAHDIQPSLRPDDEGKFVAIDIESGEYEIDREDYAAAERLLGRLPDAQIWLVRVGWPAAYRIGGYSACRPRRSVESGLMNCRSRAW